MKKILLSANTSWYLYNFRASTIKALQEKGFDVVCLSPQDAYSHRLTQELNCKWVDISIDSNGSNVIKDAILLCRFILKIRNIAPSLVFNFTVKNNIYGTIAARFLGIEAVNNISGLGTAFINENFTSKVVRLLYKISQPLAKKVFCQNPEDLDTLMDSKLVHPNKLVLLPGSGVDINRFNPNLKEVNNGSQVFCFTFVGRLLRDKGVIELIQATQQLAKLGYSFQLDLCGFIGSNNASAININYLKEICSLPYINWLGSSDKIEEVFSKSDCVVLPSYREGMPRVLLEAGAMGLPSITTNVPGCKHLITHGYNGLICDVKDSESLFKSMLIMLNMESEQYLKMCKNSRSNIERNFDENIVISHYLKYAQESPG